jgi:hypothetical protein
MKDIDKALTVDVRNSLPDELLELLRKFPRDQWMASRRLSLRNCTADRLTATLT